MPSSGQVKNVSWWHERLADWLIANPDKTLKEAARVFDVSQPYLSVLRNSDSFKAYWEMRSAEASGFALGSLKEKTSAVAELALDRMLETMSKPESILPPDLVLRTMDTALRRLGYGAAPAQRPAQNNVQVNVSMVSSADLAAARERMQTLHNVQVALPSTNDVLEEDAISRDPNNSDSQLLKLNEE